MNIFITHYALYIPFLDFITNYMKSKFKEETLDSYNLGVFVLNF